LYTEVRAARLKWRDFLDPLRDPRQFASKASSGDGRCIQSGETRGGMAQGDRIVLKLRELILSAATSRPAGG
jgi:hypothetical protein